MLVIIYTHQVLCQLAVREAVRKIWARIPSTGQRVLYMWGSLSRLDLLLNFYILWKCVTGNFCVVQFLPSHMAMQCRFCQKINERSICSQEITEYGMKKSADFWLFVQTRASRYFST
jgi:hypothetical protein